MSRYKTTNAEYNAARRRARSDRRAMLGPGRELAVVAALRAMTGRDLARHAEMPEWRVSRILQGVARPTDEELRVLRLAVWSDEP
jgi:hypothetical protein